jgi:hypothetical protein
MRAITKGTEPTSLAQHRATAHADYDIPTVRDTLLGRTTFGPEFRLYRKRNKKTARQVMDEIQMPTGISVSAGVLTVWEQCAGLPSLGLARLSLLEGGGARKLLQMSTPFQKVCTKLIPTPVGPFA